MTFIPEGSIPDQWQDRAECRKHDPEVFFPLKRAGIAFVGQDEHAEARAICAVCPVRAECLEHALRHGPTHGVWGGLDPEQRKRVRT